MPTKYREHCKPFLTPRSTSSGSGKVDAVDAEWSKFRIPDERRHEREGICPDCAVRLAGEIGGLFRRREVDDLQEREREREREDNEGKNGGGKGKGKGSGWGEWGAFFR
jgi:hypothetical protein